MAERFLSLDVFLRGVPPVAACDATEAFAGGREAVVSASEQCRCAGELAAVRRFRAALCDALDAALDELRRAIARDVLARELRLAPADVAAIAAGALERYAGERPLRLRVHPDDAAALATGDLNVVADAGLRRGDVAIDLHAGTIDATLGARLACVMEAFGVC